MVVDAFHDEEDFSSDAEEGLNVMDDHEGNFDVLLDIYYEIIDIYPGMLRCDGCQFVRFIDQCCEEIFSITSDVFVQRAYARWCEEFDLEITGIMRYINTVTDKVTKENLSVFIYYYY